MPQPNTLRAPRRLAAAIAAVVLTACGGSTATAPIAAPPAHVDSVTTFPGFDIANYPGDAAMKAWAYPSSPYYWVGDYLPAPCHFDGSFAGKYATLRQMGWGVAAIYVGQQDWTQISSALAARASVASAELATCSASLLTIQHGVDEAADAVAKMQADGFPNGSAVFLDVENVASVTPALLDYYRSWIAAVLRDGHYQPGVYASKSNAPTLYSAALDAYRAAQLSTTPPFWIAASSGFSLSSPPTAVGLSYARMWQGMFNVAQSFNGVTLRIDANVSATRSPSTP